MRDKPVRTKTSDDRTIGSMQALMGHCGAVVVVQCTDESVQVVAEKVGQTVQLTQCTVGIMGDGALCNIVSWRAGYSDILKLWFCTEPKRGAVYDPQDPIILIQDSEAGALCGERKRIGGGA